MAVWANDGLSADEFGAIGANDHPTAKHEVLISCFISIKKE